MSDARDVKDPLQAELEALRPAELPPGLEQRVGRELAARRPVAWRIGSWLVGAAAVAAAAVVVAALAWRVLRPTPRETGPLAVGPSATTRALVETDDADRPALATYRRALAGPPGALDELLDRHAARSLPGGGRNAAGGVAANSKSLLLP